MADLDVHSIRSDDVTRAEFEQFVRTETSQDDANPFAVWMAVCDVLDNEDAVAQRVANKNLHDKFLKNKEELLLPEDLVAMVPDRVDEEQAVDTELLQKVAAHLLELLTDDLLPEFLEKKAEWEAKGISDDTRKECVQAFVDRECAFVEMLNTLNTVFSKPLSAILTQQDISTLFSSMQQLLMMHQDITVSLLGSSKKSHIGLIFKAKIVYFKVYVQYCTNLHRSLDLFVELNKDNAEFAQLVREASNNPKCKQRSLLDFITAPAQHVDEYPALFAKLVEVTSPFHIDHSALQYCLQQMELLTTAIEQAMQDSKAVEAAVELQQAIDWEGLNVDLGVPNRRIVRQGPVQLVGSGSLTKKAKLEERTLVLFNDILVLCKSKNSRFKLKAAGVRKFSARAVFRLEAVALSQTDSHEHAFQVMRIEDLKVFTFVCSDQQDAKAWLEQLGACIQAAQERVEASHGSDDQGESSQEAAAAVMRLAHSKYGGVVAAMQGSKGVQVADRKGRIALYRDTFVGDEAVTWLVESKHAEAREHAESLLKEMLQDGVIVQLRGNRFGINTGIDSHESYFRFADQDVLSAGLELKFDIPTAFKASPVSSNTRNRYEAQEDEETKLRILGNLRKAHAQTSKERMLTLLEEERAIVADELNTLESGSAEHTKVAQFLETVDAKIALESA